MADAKKGVLVLVPAFGQGGAEKVASMLAEMLRDSGQYRVCFCALHAAERLPQMPGVEVRTLGVQPAPGLANKLRNYHRAIGTLRALKKELSVQLTISSLWPVDWLNALTGRERKIAVIQINILNNAQNRAMVKARPLVTAVYKRMDCVVLGSGALMEEMTGFFRLPLAKLEVIHNAINTDAIDRNIAEPLPPRLERLFAGGPVLVAANRLAEIKNTVALVRILHLLKSEPKPKLLIIGEGEERTKIEEETARLGLSWTDADEDSPAHSPNAAIHFLRFRKNIHHLFARAAIFLFPTQGEGLPLGLLEAMYSGAPVLVSDCPNGGVHEAMEGRGPFVHPRTDAEWTGGGYLMPIPLPAADVSASAADALWAEKLRDILAGTPEETIAMRAHNRSRAAHFSTDRINKQWHSLLDRLL